MIKKTSNFSYVRNSIMMIISTVLLFGCSLSSPTETSTPVDLGAVQTAAISTFAADLTRSAPTVTLIPTITTSPTLIPSLTPLQTATPTATYTSVATLNPYLVLDSTTMDLLPTYIPFYVVNPVSDDPCIFYLKPVLSNPFLPRTGKLEADVTTALNNLFWIKESWIGGFPNPFSASGHILVSMTASGNRLDIYITGWPGRTNNTCTNRAMRDQMFKTVHQISDPYGVTDVIIWQDGLLYDDYMIGG